MREFPISIGYVQSSFPVALKLINKCIQYECFGLSFVVAPFFLAEVQVINYIVGRMETDPVDDLVSKDPSRTSAYKFRLSLFNPWY